MLFTKNCVNCGKVFQSQRSDSLYCSHTCGMQYRRHAGPRRDCDNICSGNVCLWNDAITCRERACSRCGWNPSVFRDRILAEMVGGGG